MKTDKALHKALQRHKNTGLSFGFDQRVMKAVFIAAEKRKKRSTVLSFALVSLVSLLIIGGATYLIKTYTSFCFSLTFPRIHFSEESRDILFFSFYIGSIVLVLLGFDSFFRKLKNDREK